LGLVVGFLAWIVIMPLDAKRYAWSGPFPLWLKALGGCALLASSFFFFRSYTDNTLREELEGYADYTRRVRYRLIPYVW